MEDPRREKVVEFLPRVILERTEKENEYHWRVVAQLPFPEGDDVLWETKTDLTKIATQVFTEFVEKCAKAMKEE